jgi:hypothetical protein
MPDEPTRAPVKNLKQATYRALVRRAWQARTRAAKGQALECLMEYLLSCVVGLEVQATDFRGPAEEIDLVVWNDRQEGVFASWEPVFFVECKNWSSPVGVADVVVFIDKLRRVGLKNGLLVARNGLTGDARKDACLLLREALRDGIRIIVFTLDELRTVRDMPDFLSKCREKYCKVFLSQL